MDAKVAGRGRPSLAFSRALAARGAASLLWPGGAGSWLGGRASRNEQGRCQQGRCQQGRLPCCRATLRLPCSAAGRRPSAGSGSKRGVARHERQVGEAGQSEHSHALLRLLLLL